MALARVNLGYPVAIGTGSTISVYTVTSSQKSYVRALMIHNTNDNSPTNFAVNIVQNSSGSVGIATSGNRMIKGALVAGDTYFVEFTYPIVLETNNDTIQVSNYSTTHPLNILVLGDREA